MRFHWCFVVIAVLIVSLSTESTVCAQAAAGQSSRPEGEPFFLKIDEYKIGDTLRQTKTSSEILEQLLKKDVVPARTFHVRSYDETEAFVQVGERIAIGDKPKDKTEFLEVGTIIRLRAKITDEKVVVDFDYTALKLAESDTENAAVRLNETTLQTVTEMKIGEPVLLGGANAKNGFYLVATISKNQEK
ncbi:MAG: hypothetical protein AAGG48_27495 [Planctomycetota bacterium]